MTDNDEAECFVLAVGVIACHRMNAVNAALVVEALKETCEVNGVELRILHASWEKHDS